MSVPFSGGFFKAFGIAGALSRELKMLTLRPARRIQITFDPFSQKAVHARDFLYHISAPKIGNTNPSCVIKTEIVCDRREPTVTFKLDPEYTEKLGAGELTFKGDNLTCLDILKLYNEHVSALVPKEAPVETGPPKKLKKLRKRRMNKRR